MKRIIVAAALLASQVALAGILEPVAGSREIENVNIAESAKVTVEGRVSQVVLAGAGLRQKKVVIANVDVYVAQLFVSDIAKYVRTSEGALDSLKDSKAVAIKLNLLRSLDADKVASSFKDALEANKVNTSGGSIQAFIALAQTDAPSGKTVVIVGERLVDGSEVVTIEKPTGEAQSIKGQAGFIRDVFSIWLGTPADSGLEKLKKALVGAGS